MNDSQKASEVFNREIQRLKMEEEALMRQVGELQEKIEQIHSEQLRLKAMRAIFEGEIVSLPGMSRTKKNEKVHQAWNALQYAFVNPPGKQRVRTADIERSMQSLIPDLKPTTFRAYLHKFKAKGLIEKKPHGIWVLTINKNKLYDEKANNEET